MGELSIPEEADPGAPRVLVVDDSRTMRALIAMTLLAAGLEVTEASTGEDALVIAARDAEKLDCIVLDVTLPGISGYDVLGKLQSEPATARIPVLLLTANATSTDDVVRGIRAGAVDHLTKPVQEPILIAKVQGACARRQADRALRAQLEHTPSMPSTPFAPGVLIADRYRLIRHLGTGASAAVYEAEDSELSERVAVKVLTRDMANDEALERFKRELSIMRQLIHPNIVRVFDYGSYGATKFFTMELLSGVDLRTRMSEGPGTLELLDYLLQACTGLQAAHDKSVVHRDIKPENFFVTSSGILKIMDFGIAKGKSVSHLTMDGGLAGTPTYMAPEQISGFSTVTAAADLYALGVIAYEMFTGAPPFDHDEMYPLMMMHMSSAPPPPRHESREIPGDLEQLILRLLEKDPSARFSSARELGRRLIEIRNRLSAEGVE